MTSGTLITNYLILHLPREFPGLDVWRAAVVKASTPRGYVQAGEIGQADITGVWGGRCICGKWRQDDIDWDSEHPEASNHGACSGCSGCKFIPCGRSVWIEVKSPGDKQKPAQRDFERRVTRLGALYVICAVKKRETVREIKALMPGKVDSAFRHVQHPAEITAFIADLKDRL